jgi:hypothetical protein
MAKKKIKKATRKTLLGRKPSKKGKLSKIKKLKAMAKKRK